MTEKRAVTTRKEHLAFLEGAFEDFSSAIYATDRDGNWKGTRESKNREAVESIDYHLHYMLPVKPLWESVNDYYSMLRSRLRSGSLVIGDDDAMAFCFAVVSVPPDMSHIVEHFIDTDEFADFVDMWAVAAQEITPAGKLFEPLGVRVRVQRLYDFDLSHGYPDTQEQGEETPLQLPLDVRAHFSGFYDDVSDDEIIAESVALYGY